VGGKQKGILVWRFPDGARSSIG